MPTGYRCIIIAAFGWLSLAAGPAPKQSAQPDNAASQSEVSAAAKTVASAISNAAKSSKEDGGCQQGQDERSSDLCAQWKAADAARDAADYALIGLIVTAIGTGLLVWTLWETRVSTRREARAYIKVSPIEGSGQIEAEKPICIVLNVINYGMTPAIDCEFQHAVGLNTNDWKWSSDLTVTRRGHTSITVARDSPLQVEILSAGVITAAQFASVARGELTIYARGTFFYRDIFKRQRVTQISMEIRALELSKLRVRIAATGNIAT
jgi:hypothetical protein